MARDQIPEERRQYCASIRQLAPRLAQFRRSGLSMTGASEAMRQVELSENLDVDEVAMRESGQPQRAATGRVTLRLWQSEDAVWVVPFLL